MKKFMIILVALSMALAPFAMANFTEDGADLSPTKIVFEGATDDAYETTLAITDPTADRTITVPNADVTIGTATTITDDLIVKADLANEDWGDVSVASNAVTLDAHVVDAAALVTMVAADGANTSCATTCGNASAIVGFDSGSNVFVGPTDASADTCICDGAVS